MGGQSWWILSSSQGIQASSLEVTENHLRTLSRSMTDSDGSLMAMDGDIGPTFPSPEFTSSCCVIHVTLKGSGKRTNTAGQEHNACVFLLLANRPDSYFTEKRRAIRKRITSSPKCPHPPTSWPWLLGRDTPLSCKASPSLTHWSHPSPPQRLCPWVFPLSLSGYLVFHFDWFFLAAHRLSYLQPPIWKQVNEPQKTPLQFLLYFLAPLKQNSSKCWLYQLFSLLFLQIQSDFHHYIFTGIPLSRSQWPHFHISHLCSTGHLDQCLHWKY